MSAEKSTTAVDNLEVGNYLIIDRGDTLVISKKNTHTKFLVNDNGVSVYNSNTPNSTSITEKGVTVDDKIVIQPKGGRIYEYVKWDEDKLVLGDDAIIITEQDLIFNAIVNKENLSVELLDLIEKKRGEQGPPGPPGKPGVDGVDGKDTSRYTWLLYSVLNPSELPDGGDIIDRATITLDADRNTNFIGMLYNQRDAQNGRFGDPNMYTWMKYSGDNAYAVSISGSNIFKIPKNQKSDEDVPLVASPETLTFTAVTTFDNIKGRKWKYYDNTQKKYVNVSDSGTIDTESYTVRYDDTKLFQGTNMAKLMVVCEPDDKLYPDTKVMDEVFIHKLYEGDDAFNIILSNPVHNLVTDNNGVVLSTSYTDAYSDVMFFIGTEQKDIKPSDFKITTRYGTTTTTTSSITVDGHSNVRVSVTNLSEDADVIDITHEYSKIKASMSIYKAGDGKARFVRISGPTVVWKEGEVFDPAEITLMSIGYGGVVPKNWQYKTSKTDNFVDIPNSTLSDLKITTSDYFTQGVDNVDFKVKYEEQYTHTEVHDVHRISKLYYGYSLDLSNSQDKVPINDFNEYIFTDVYTDISLFQGKRLVPITVVDNINTLSLRGGENIVLGDIAIEAANPNTTYTVENLTGNDAFKVRLRITKCTSNELITITHLESNTKRVFTVLMDNPESTSVKIISENMFHIDNDDDARPDFIVMSSVGVHLKDTESIQWSYQDIDGNWQNVPVWGDNNGKKSTYTVYPDIKSSSETNRWLGYTNESVRFKVAYGTDPTNQDTMTVFRFKDGGHAVGLDLVNETIAVDTDQFGNIPKNEQGDIIQNIYTPIDFYVGGKPIASTINDYTATCTNIRGELSAIPSDSNTVKYTVKDLTADHGTVEISRTYKGVRYYRILNIFKNKKGDKGDTGDYTTYIYKSSNTIPEQPKGINLSTNQSANGWYDTPSTEGIWWMSNARVSGVTNKTITEFTTPLKVTTIDGLDSYVLDLSNENASVACESDGTVIGKLPACKATLYVGGNQLTNNVQFNISPAVKDVSIDNNGNITITNLHSDTTEINVVATFNALTFKQIMTVSKVKAGKDSVVYDLKPSVNAVLISDDSIITPSTISCNYNIEQGINNYLVDSASVDLGELTTGVVLKVWTTTSQKDTVLAVGANFTPVKGDKIIKFKLFKGDVLVDTESVPMVADGSVHVYEYAIGDKATAPETGWGSVIPTIPSGKFLWSRTYKIINGTKFILGTWRISGEDATNYYTHVRYASALNVMLPTDATDAQILSAIYMGVRTTTDTVVSNVWADYSWSKIKGETGSIGPQGERGPQGVIGPIGPDGKATYTWIRYSPNSDGSSMTNNPNVNSRYLGLAYNKNTATESDVPSDYTWTKIKGEQGDTGEQGPIGPDGKPRYTWIKYAEDANGKGFKDVPDTNTNYIGLAYNKETAAESDDYRDYVWSKFKGDTGATGPQGDRGPEGAVGPIGPNGQPTYTWIRYSPNSDGSNMTNNPDVNSRYLGLAYNKNTATESNNASDYTWSKIKGDKGDTGEQGPIGPDGKPRYTWVKYANSSTGAGMTDVPTENTTHIGLAYNKLVPEESNNASDYTWSKFKGEDGTDGVSNYMHIKYSMSSDGSNFVSDPSGMPYIGLANTNSSTAPSNKASYKWSKIKGEDGLSVKGEDGKTYYLYVRYSSDGGKTMTETAVSGTTHIGTAVTLSTTAPTTVGSYTWVQVKGEPGDRGLTPYLKIWNATDIFRRTSTYQDHVIYRYTENDVEKSKYYTLVEGVFSSQAQNPMSTPSVWVEIESFQMVATNTILAENANLGGFIFKNNKLVSQKTHLENGVEVPNIILDGYGGSIEASTGVFKGYIEATSGYISGELKIGKNTGILKLNLADLGNVYIGPNSPVFYTGKVKPVYPEAARAFDKMDAIRVACAYPDGDRSAYSSYFVIDDLGDLHGRNAKFDGAVHAERLDITGRIRQRYVEITKPVLINDDLSKFSNVLDVFNKCYYYHVTPATTNIDKSYIYIAEPMLKYGDSYFYEDDADGTEINLIIKNESNQPLFIWGATQQPSDPTVAIGFPIYHDGGRTELSVNNNSIMVIKLLYSKHAYEGVFNQNGTVSEKRSKWLPVSMYEMPKLFV